MRRRTWSANRASLAAAHDDQDRVGESLGAVKRLLTSYREFLHSRLLADRRGAEQAVSSCCRLFPSTVPHGYRNVLRHMVVLVRDVVLNADARSGDCADRPLHGTAVRVWCRTARDVCHYSPRAAAMTGPGGGRIRVTGARTPSLHRTRCVDPTLKTASVGWTMQTSGSLPARCRDAGPHHGLHLIRRDARAA